MMGYRIRVPYNDDNGDEAPCKRVLFANLLQRLRAVSGDPNLTAAAAKTMLRNRFKITNGNAARLMDLTTDVRIGTVAEVAKALGVTLIDLLAADEIETANGRATSRNVYGLPPKMDRRSHDPDQVIYSVQVLLDRVPELLRDSAQEAIVKFVEGRSTPEQAVMLLARLTDPEPPRQSGGAVK